MGSRSDCGRSQWRHGLEASYSPSSQWIKTSRTTFRAGSFPQDQSRQYSSPKNDSTQRVCNIALCGVATSAHFLSRSMSRRHSSAATFVMCARGVLAVNLAQLIIMTDIPSIGKISSSEITTVVCKEASERGPCGTCADNQNIDIRHVEVSDRSWFHHQRSVLKIGEPSAEAIGTYIVPRL